MLLALYRAAGVFSGILLVISRTCCIPAVKLKAQRAASKSPTLTGSQVATTTLAIRLKKLYNPSGCGKKAANTASKAAPAGGLAPLGTEPDSGSKVVM